MFKTTKALVLREVKYKEADKILTVLTEDEGKLTVCARGVLRKGSKIAAACQLLTFSEMTLFENRGKWYINEGQTIEQFLGLREDIADLALGVYFAELLEAVSDEDSPNPQVLSLGLNSLYALARHLYSPEHIKAVFELKLMCLSGYEPGVDCCGSCGSEAVEEADFGLYSGCLVCRDCSIRESRDIGRKKLDIYCIRAMRHIVDSWGKKLFSFTLEDGSMKFLSSICEEYVSAQLERRFSSLDYWKSVR